jgi:hypothetical protein
MPPEGVRPDYALHENQAWLAEAGRYIAAHPLQTLGRSLAKGLTFWNPHYGEQFLLLIGFVLGWVRLIRGRRRLHMSPALVWVLAAPFVMTLVHMAFFVQPRYMIPVLPMVCIVAGAGFCGWLKDGHKRRGRGPHYDGRSRAVNSSIDRSSPPVLD